MSFYETNAAELKAQKEAEPSTATTFYPSTSLYTSRSWGFYDTTNNTLCEQITPSTYLCNDKGTLSLISVNKEKSPDDEKKWLYFLPVGERKYYFTKKPWDVSFYYAIPGIDRCKLFVAGKLAQRSIKEIMQEVQHRLKTIYDLGQEQDAIIISLFIVQSHLKAVLKNFFFLGIDATKGGGKTTLLEIITYLSRHGYLGGDVSAASLPRLVEELDLALALDELDQRLGKGEDDSVNILRKGQRRGNPYVRLNKHSLVPEQYDVAGTHSFSFRGELEDAFMSRSLSIHASESKDKTLPIVNFYKQTILRDLQEELFFWGIVHVPEIARQVQDIEQRLKSIVEACSNVEGCSSNSTLDTRQTLYNEIVKDFSKEQLAVFEQISGRNVELAFMLVQLSRVIGLEVTDTIRFRISEKQQQELFGNEYHLESLRDFLVKAYEHIKSGGEEGWILADGSNAGCVAYPKNAAYTSYCKVLKEDNIAIIGTKKYSSLLRDLKFIEGVNLTSQRPPQMSPRQCLIFTHEILQLLGIHDTIFEKQRMREWFDHKLRPIEEFERAFPGIQLKPLLENGTLYSPKAGFVAVLE